MNYRMPEPGEGLLFGGDISTISKPLVNIVNYLSPLGYKLYCAEEEVGKYLESQAEGSVSIPKIEFPVDNKQALREVFERYDIRGVFNLAKARAKTVLDVDYVMRRSELHPLTFTCYQKQSLISILQTLWTSVFRYLWSPRPQNSLVRSISFHCIEHLLTSMQLSA